MKNFVLPVALALCMSVVIHGQTVKAPPIVLRDTSGKSVKLSELRGKTILLNFWATWCIPCAAEVEDLVKWQAQYRSAGLQIVGITYPPTNAVKVRSFVRTKKINYPILYGSKKTKQLFDRTDTLPITIIIDKEGNIRGRIDGVIFPDEFDKQIRPLLEMQETAKPSMPDR